MLRRSSLCSVLCMYISCPVCEQSTCCQGEAGGSVMLSFVGYCSHLSSQSPCGTDPSCKSGTGVREPISTWNTKHRREMNRRSFPPNPRMRRRSRRHHHQITLFLLLCLKNKNKNKKPNRMCWWRILCYVSLSVGVCGCCFVFQQWTACLGEGPVVSLW